MTRSALTKLTATALAVASLGLASTAQAAEQNIAIGEPVPGSGVPQQPAQPAGGDGDYHGPEDGSQAKPERPKTCKELQAMGYKIGCKDWRHRCPADAPCPYPYPEPHPHPHPYPHPKPYPQPEPHKPVYKETEPAYKTSEPSKGSLPFTGLEIWQLGLIGAVLAGGGLGVRRLIAA